MVPWIQKGQTSFMKMLLLFVEIVPISMMSFMRTSQIRILTHLQTHFWVMRRFWSIKACSSLTGF